MMRVWLQYFLVFVCFLIFSSYTHSALAQEKVYVQDIYIIGTKKTRNSTILRELSFQVGDSLLVGNLDPILERNRLNVFNLELFNTVSIEANEVAQGVIVVIRVKERWYIFPLPGIEIEERNAYDFFKNPNFRRVSYSLQLRARNLTGRNETLRCFAQAGFSKILAVYFKRPSLFPKRLIDFEAYARYVNRKEIITHADSGRVQWNRLETEPLRQTYEGRIGFTKRFSLYTNLYMGAGYQHYRFADSIHVFSEAHLTSEGTTESFPFIRIDFWHDTRDYRSFPMSGFKYQALLRLTGIPNVSTSSFAKLGLSFAHHLPLSKRWNFSYGTQHLFAFGKYIPYFEKHFVGIGWRGYDNTTDNIRGYEQYVIDGSYIGMAKTELKFAVFPLQNIHIKWIPFKKFRDFPLGIYLSTYFDMGYVDDNTFSAKYNPWLKNTYLYGYGLGVNLIGLYDIMVRVEYSRNHLGQGGFYFSGSIPIK